MFKANLVNLRALALLWVDLRNHVPPLLTDSRKKLCLCNQPTELCHASWRATRVGMGKPRASPRALFMGYQSIEMSCQVRSKQESAEDRVRRCGIRKREDQGFSKAQPQDKLRRSSEANSTMPAIISATFWGRFGALPQALGMPGTVPGAGRWYWRRCMVDVPPDWFSITLSRKNNNKQHTYILSKRTSEMTLKLKLERRKGACCAKST